MIKIRYKIPGTSVGSLQHCLNVMKAKVVCVPLTNRNFRWYKYE